MLGHLEGRLHPQVGLRIGLDTGLVELGSQGARIDGRDFEDGLKQTLWLGQMWLDLQFGSRGGVRWLTGKLRPSIGGSAVFDQYGFGSVLDIDFGLLGRLTNPWRARLTAILPDGRFTEVAKRSPLFAAEVGYDAQGVWSARLHQIVLVDTEGLLRPLVADRIRAEWINNGEAAPGQFRIATNAWVSWTGLTAQVRSSGVRARLRAFFDIGRLQYRPVVLRNPRRGPPPPEPTAGSLDLVSFFASADAQWPVAPELRFDAFVMAIGGEPSESLGDDDGYRGFVSLAPFLPFTSIFFNGATAGQVASDTVDSLAPDGRGLLAAGVGARWAATHRVALETRVAAMFSAAPADGGRFIGFEANGEVWWVLDPSLALRVSAGFLVPGAYFGDDMSVVGQVAVAIWLTHAASDLLHRNSDELSAF